MQEILHYMYFCGNMSKINLLNFFENKPTLSKDDISENISVEHCVNVINNKMIIIYITLITMQIYLINIKNLQGTHINYT